MFSPSLATSPRRRSSRLSPASGCSAPSASTVAGPSRRALSATLKAKAPKSGPRATKSVSQFTSTMAAVRESADLTATTSPSAATRVAFLSALARPWRRISSAAASRSPLVSTSAFLHSIIPAPVRSRSCRTASAVIFIATRSPQDIRSFPRGSLARACAGPTTPLAAAGAGGWPADLFLCGNRDRGRHSLRGLFCLVGFVELLLLRQHLGGACGRLDRRKLAAGRGFLAHRRLRALRPTGGLLARLPGLIELHELVLADGHPRHGLLALEHRVGNARCVELDRAHGVVVTGNHVVDSLGRAIGVDDRHHRYAELARLVHGDVFVADVDHEQGIRKRLHVLDAAQAPLQLVHLATQLRGFLLAALLERTGCGELGDLGEPLD